MLVTCLSIFNFKDLIYLGDYYIESLWILIDFSCADSKRDAIGNSIDIHWKGI